MKSRKEELEHSNAKFKESLENQFEELKDNFQDTGKKALWIGGALVLAYGLTSLLTSGGKKKDDGEEEIEEGEIVEVEVSNQPNKTQFAKIIDRVPSEASVITEAIKHQAIVFLLGLAARKLADFLSDLAEKEPESDS